MVLQRDKGLKPESFETGLPPASSGDDVPRWLAVAGLAAGLTLFVALLRYALDLLGVVFVIILVGFAIRAASDWMTEGESVSGWAVSALSTGLMGTVLVGLWLFNSSTQVPLELQSRLPGPIQQMVAWLESHGWGQRVLLPGSQPIGFGGGPDAAVARLPSAPPPVAVERDAPAMEPRALPAPRPERPVTRTPPPPASRESGEAEAAQLSQPAPAPAPAPAPPAPVARTDVTVTMTATPTAAVVGRAVRLTATVTGDSDPAPTGFVTFDVDRAVLGRVPVRNGTAILSTLDLSIGDHVVSATYGGDARHHQGRSSAVSITVTRR